MRTPPLLAAFILSRVCKPFCAKSLTLPWPILKKDGRLRLISFYSLLQTAFYEHM